jgi:hypothetical protein
MVDRSAEPAEMSYVEKLVFRFMEEVEQVADHELWAESDGWVGKMVLTDSLRGDRVYVYEIKDGKMTPSNSPGPFVGTMTMSEETFLDLITAATSGTGEVVFQRKYAGRHLHYQGDQWLVDSERFRKVFRRLAAAHRRKV